ncbi:FMRFamide receptor isoform X2 [Folsomia candida]|nr:FMRFamide receptor isoform X2 [Folsomia candida]
MAEEINYLIPTIQAGSIRDQIFAMEGEQQDEIDLLQYANCSQGHELEFGSNNCSLILHPDWMEEDGNFSIRLNDSHSITCPDSSDASLEGGDLFRFIVLGIGISVVAILGIIGNGLSAVVLSRPQMKSSVTCLLLGLTFCDTLLISISIFVYSMPYMSIYIKSPFLLQYYYLYYPIVAPWLYATSITAQTASVYLTVAVTIERYIAVCHSLQARSICTWRRARMCVVAVLTFSITYNLPRWFEVITVPDECARMRTNVTTYMNEMSELRGNEYYIKFYINWAYCIIMYLIPFSGLVVFNFCIYRQVRKANRERAQLSKLQKREMGLASMLLIVVVVFLMCNILPLVNNILESIWNVEVEKLIALSNFLVIFNSSVNFVIYCTCGERFRRLLIRLCRDFMWCRVKGKQGSNGFYRKSQYYRSQHGGEFEEMSLASMANHTCITTSNGITGNGTMLVDLSGGERPKHLRNPYRERNKTIPILHNYNNRHVSSNGNGQNGKHVDRRVSSPSGPRQ